VSTGAAGAGVGAEPADAPASVATRDAASRAAESEPDRFSTLKPRFLKIGQSQVGWSELRAVPKHTMQVPFSVRRAFFQQLK
jgi:hypothetical protein